jgi:hypothetical protein
MSNLFIVHMNLVPPHKTIFWPIFQWWVRIVRLVQEPGTVPSLYSVGGSLFLQQTMDKRLMDVLLASSNYFF